MNLPFFSFKKYIRALIAALSLTLMLILVLSAVFSVFPPGEKALFLIASFVPYFASFSAAVFAGIASEKNGALTGLCTALILFLILAFSGSVFFGNVFKSFSPKNFGAVALCGICGGILGINIGQR